MRNFYLIIIFLILIFITNTHAQDNILDETKDGKKILKIGILLPLSGEHKKLGHIVLNSIKMAVKDINKENITILPKDSGSNALTSLVVYLVLFFITSVLLFIVFFSLNVVS